MSGNKAAIFKRSIPVKYNTDVFIAGGGPAGVAAAVAAARNGCGVYLAENQSCLGGAGTAGLVPAFMQFSDGVNFLAGGIGEEILNKLRKKGGTGTPEGFSIKSEVLKRVYDELMKEAEVNFTFDTRLIAVETQGENVVHGILAAKSGLFAVSAKIFIDCTGDGDLAAWAGAPYEKGDENGNLMPGTLCSLWSDVNWSETDNKIPSNRYIDQACEDGVLTVRDYHLPGMWKVGETVGGGNIGHAFGVDSTDEVSLTNALIEQRKRLVEYEQYYRRYFKGFEKAEIVSTGAILGIRESRRIIGDYILNIDDFKSRGIFDDEIGRYCYPVDIHPSRPDPASYKKFEEEYSHTLRYGKGESYGIPYRCLVPKNLSNVLVAGRCISSDRYIQGSVRVMPGCYITGQAAGTAAAIAVENNTHTRGFDISLLRKKLKDMGAYLIWN